MHQITFAPLFRSYGNVTLPSKYQNVKRGGIHIKGANAYSAL